jgi:hypothetical protein
LRLEEAVTGAHPRLQFLAAGLPLQLAGPLFLVGAAERLRTARWGRDLIGGLARNARYSFPIYLTHCAWLVVIFEVWKRSALSTTAWQVTPTLFALTWIAARTTAAAAERSRCAFAMAVLYGTRPAARA